MSEADHFIAVGRVTRAHGLKGEVAVLPLSQVDTRFEPGSKLFLDEGEASVTVATSRPHKGRLLVTFREIRDRDQAERLGGRYLLIPASSSPSLPEGEYWPHEVVGARVETAEGRLIGTIREIIHTPANDVWVARDDAGEVLIPALKDVVESVDVPGRRVIVREVPGLTVP